MAVAVDVRTAGSSNAGGTSLSWTHVMGSVANGALLVQLGFAGTSTADATSVVWDSGGANTGMTASQNQVSGSNDCEASLWHLAAPASGSKTIKATFGANTANFGIGGSSSSYSGVASGVWRAGSRKGSTNASGTMVVTSQAGDYVVDAFCDDNGGTLPTKNASSTLIGRSSPGANIDVGGSDQTGGASVTMTWTFAGGAAWGWVGGSLQAAAGGGFTAIERRTLPDQGTRVGSRQVSF